MTEPEKIEKILEMSERILQFDNSAIDYQKIVDDFRDMIGAKFVAFNLFDKHGETFTTVALSGNKGIIKKASEVIGIKLNGRVWPQDLKRMQKIENKTITRFKELTDLTGDILPVKAISLIEKTFNLGEVLIAKILRKGIMLGDFTIMMDKGQAFEDEKITELYTRQIGILITKKLDQDELERKEKEILESEENFRTFFEAMDDIILVGNREGNIIYANNALEKKLGYSRDDVKNLKLIDLNPQEKRAEAEQIFGDMLAGNRNYCPLPVVKKDGTHMPAETRVWFGKWNGEDCIFGDSKDLTTQQAALDQVTKVFNCNPAFMALTRMDDGIFIEVNDSFLQGLGYVKEEIIGKTAQDLGLFLDPEAQLKSHEMLKNEGRLRNIELQVRKKSGEIRQGLFSGEVIEIQGASIFLTVMNDITEQKKAQDESLHDYLTGLYNRRFYEEELRRLDNERNMPLSLIVGDVNGLKEINDHYGHMIGDEMLKIISAAIKKSCREDDIIARVGGDEFVVILPKTPENKANEIIAKIHELISLQMINNKAISIALGCRAKCHTSESIHETFRIAEACMYNDKSKAR